MNNTGYYITSDGTKVDFTTVLKNSVRLIEHDIVEINLDNCLNVKHIYLNNNKLSTIDISKCINLKNLYIWGNKLTNIDISQNINLRELDICDNMLSSLDISNNCQLSRLWIYKNNIKELDISILNNSINFICRVYLDSKIKIKNIKSYINKKNILINYYGF